MITQENIPYTADEIKAMVKTCEKYNKALEKAKKLYGKYCINNVLEDLFPELKESNDERIRKTLIEYIKGIKSWNYFLGISKGQMIAWLEKQGGHKGTDNGETEFHVGDLVVINETVYQITEIDDSHVVLSFNGRECKFELDVLNNAQKFESQFKVGDWITNGRYVRLVVGVDSRHYQFKDGDAKYIDDIDKKYHLWTIDDARDGDILACNKEILLFKSSSTQGHISLHCWYNGQTNSFHSKAVYDTLMTTRNKICPATREQRELFIQKMKEAGFEWSTKTKEVKEIEPKNPIVDAPSRELILSIWDLGNEWKELTNGSSSTEYGTQLEYIQKHWQESSYYDNIGDNIPTLTSKDYDKLFINCKH